MATLTAAFTVRRERGEPTTIEFGDCRYTGISIAFTKSRQSFSVSGWFDTCVGIEGGSLSLGEFCSAFGITPRMVERALTEATEATS